MAVRLRAVVRGLQARLEVGVNEAKALACDAVGELVDQDVLADVAVPRIGEQVLLAAARDAPAKTACTSWAINAIYVPRACFKARFRLA